MSGARYGKHAAVLVLGVGAAVLGYVIPIVGTILTVCLLLVLIAALLGDNGAMAEVVMSPFKVLGAWLAQKDDSRWLRRAPFIGLVAGWLIRWVANGLAAQGGA